MTKRVVFWLVFFLAFFVFLYAIRTILLPFVLGIFAAYFLDPAADRLEKWKFSRSVATAIITVGFFVIIALLGVLIIPQLFGQLAELARALPGYIEHYEAEYVPQISAWLGGLPAEHLESLKQATKDMSGTLVSAAGNAVGGLFQSGIVLVHLLSLILITPVVVFYLLRDWDTLIARLYELLPRAHEHTIRQQLGLMDQTISAFIRGQLNVCFILAVYYAIALSFVGLNFAIVIGVLSGLLVIIPYIGVMFGTGLALMVAFFQFGTLESVITVLALYVVGQMVEGSFITPKLVGDKVGLHPVWIIFGMLAGATLFGFVGVLIAVPLTAVIGVLIRFATSRYLQSSLYSGK